MGSLGCVRLHFNKLFDVVLVDYVKYCSWECCKRYQDLTRWLGILTVYLLIIHQFF